MKPASSPFRKVHIVALRFFPWLLAILVAALLAASWRRPAIPAGDFDYDRFGEIPVLDSGRLKPLDTVARNALMIICGKQSLRLENGKSLSAAHWLADVLFRPFVAKNYPMFRIDNPEVLGLFGWEQGSRKYFSYLELDPFLKTIDEEGWQADQVESPHRSPYQNAILNLRNSLIICQRLRHSFAPSEARAFTGEADARATLFPTALEYDRASNPAAFNRCVANLLSKIAAQQPALASRASFECLFNRIAPFYESSLLYVLAFLLVCASWLCGPRFGPCFNRAALIILLLAFTLHTFGLGARMALQGRPPVTNLYSSAIFIGWGAVIIGLILERIFRDGIGLSCAATIGFVTLIIAHHLAGSGDTLEMLTAVLNNNFWLATHVVSITLGYSAMFLAGLLAVIYILRGFLTREEVEIKRLRDQTLARMIYGVICFATLFSFAGTVLGGIWADQSWGRFWGWDPKENGALIIVLWCAIILHARWGGFVRQRGLVVMALFGNIVTSFSWFGVNMLGIGLHSYGFMEGAFPWLIAFMAVHFALMALAAIPRPKALQTPNADADPQSSGA